MKSLTTFTLALAVMSGTVAMADDDSAKKEVSSIHDLKVRDIDGKEVDLSKYKGKVLLVVNVASRCGATPQYKNLQAMYKKYSDRGLVVMGFPCNQFGRQEPGSNSDIKQFCSVNYEVTFPMFDKIEVNGKGEAPLYSYLKSNADDHSDIGWNFEKFVISKEGKVVARFSTRTKPDAPEVLKVIEEQMSM